MDNKVTMGIALLALLLVLLVTAPSVSDGDADPETVGEDDPFPDPIVPLDTKNCTLQSYFASGVKMQVGWVDLDGDGFADDGRYYLTEVRGVNSSRVVNIDKLLNLQLPNGAPFPGVTDFGDGGPIVEFFTQPSRINYEYKSTTVKTLQPGCMDYVLYLSPRSYSYFTMPNLLNIGDGVFDHYQYSLLRKCDFSSVEYVGEGAFMGCEMYSSKLPSLRYADSYAFMETVFGKTVNFPHLEAINKGVFRECISPDGFDLPSLTRCDFGKNNKNTDGGGAAPFHNAEMTYLKLPAYPYLDDILIKVTADKVEMDSARIQNDGPMICDIGTLYLPSLDASTLKMGAVYRGEDGWKYYFDVENVVLSDTTVIGEDAFLMNPYIKTVKAPNVTEICSNAFSGSSLTEFEFSELRYVRDGAFRDCQITTPGYTPSNQPEFIGESAYRNTLLTEIHFNKVPYLGEYAFAGTLAETADFTGMADVPAGLVMGCPITEIVGFGSDTVSKDLFRDTGLTSFDMSGIVWVGEGGFENTCLATMDAAVITHVGARAFAGTLLTDLVAPELEFIGDEAFMMTRVNSIITPSLTCVGDNAFGNMVLEGVVVGVLEEVGDSVFRDCGLDESVFDLSRLRIAGNQAFSGNHLKHVGNSLEDVGPYAFSGNQITELDCPSLVYADAHSFSGNPITVFNLPALQFAGDYAFYGSKITELDCPELNEVGASCFEGVPIQNFSLPNLHVAHSNAFKDTQLTGVLRMDQCLIGSGAFENTRLTEAVLSGGDAIGSYAFRNVTTLTGVECDAALVGEGAFSGCTSLSRADMPNLTVIEGSAFENTWKLDMRLNTVTDVGPYAFRGSGISEVEISPMPGVHIGEGAFQDSGIVSFESYDYMFMEDRAFSGSQLSDITLVKGEFGKDIFLGCPQLCHVTISEHAYFDTSNRFYDSEGNYCDTGGRISGSFVYIDDGNILLDSRFRMHSGDIEIGFPGAPLDKTDFDMPYNSCMGFINTDIGEWYPTDHTEIPLKCDEYKVYDGFFHPYFDLDFEYKMYIDGVSLTGASDDTDLSQTIPSWVYIGTDKYPVRGIGSMAFYYREDLKSACFDNIVQIGKYAFAGSGLEGAVEFNNLKQLEGLGEAVFRDCRGITEFVGSDTGGRYHVYNGALFETDMWGLYSILYYYPVASEAISFTTPEGCIIIAECAFQNAVNLKHVIMNPGLREIQQDAFRGLSSITEYVIPDTVEELWSSSFGKTDFYEGSNLLDKEEVPGHRYVGNAESMYLSDDDDDTPAVLNLNGMEVEQPYPDYAELDENGNLVLPEDPVAVGYVFIGWNDCPDGSGEFHETGEPGREIDLLYAIWELEVYNIIYENMKGADNPNPDTYTIKDDFYIMPPHRDDAGFYAWLWNDDPEFVINIHFEAGLYLGDQLFTAVWLETYSVTYIGLDGAEDPGNPTEYMVGETFTLKNPERNGYEFLGWTGNGYNSPTLSMTVYPGMSGDLEFTAHWRIYVYTIEYTGVDGADNSMNPSEYTVEDEITIRNPIKEGYKFKGWNEPGYSRKVIEPVIQKGSTGDLVCNANWEPVEYGITYTGIEDADNSVNPDRYTIEDTVILKDIARDDYDFLGWTGEGVTEPTRGLTLPSGSTGDRTFTAHWIEAGFDIRYAGVWNAQNDNPTKYREGDSFVLKDAVHEGFEFRGWTGNGVAEPTKGLKVEAGTVGDLLFVAHWTADSYSVTYDGLEGADNSANPVSYTIWDSFVLDNPSREGYRFIGWTGNGVTEPVIEMEVAVGTTGDLHFTANWKASVYMITYEGLNGADNSANPVEYTVEDSFVLKDPFLTGYGFLGWTGDGTEQPEKGIAVPAGTMGNLTFAAHWEAVVYSITYLGVENADSNENPATYTIEDSFVLADPARGGFEFLGWTVRDTDEPVKGIEVPAGTTGDLKFTARWNALTYTITYLGIEDADNRGNPTAYTAGDSITLRDPIREGYVFLGWTGEGVTVPEKELTIPETAYGDLTFTANWEFIITEVPVDLGDTVTEAAFDGSITRNEDGTVSVPETEPSAEGYEFIGWYTSADGGEQITDGDVFAGETLYAEWGLIVYDIVYDIPEGAENRRNPAEYTVEDSFMLSIPRYEGYEFLGWTGDGITEPTVVVNVAQGTTGDLSFTAHMEIIEYVIVYSWVLGADNDNPARYTVEDSFVLADASRAGFEFLGWTGNGVNEPAKDLKIEKGTTGFLKFRANWTPIEYGITYAGLEDAVNPNPATYNLLDLPMILEQPVREGYRFVGWNDGSTVSPERVISAGTTGDLTFKAEWELMQHTVTVHAEGGILELNGAVVQTPCSREYAYGTAVSVEHGTLAVGDDVFEASRDNDVVIWSVQANADTVDRDLRARALFLDVEDTAVSAEIATMPDKTDYVLGERFDPDGMTLKVTHRSGKVVETESGYTCHPEVFTDLATDHVDVIYGGFTMECPVTVSDAVEGIIVTDAPDKVDYVYGDWFDPAGMEVSAVYLSGMTAEVEDYSYSPEKLDSLGTVQITIAYRGFTAYQDVNVTPRAEPVPDETDRFVYVHVDEAGKISADSALAAVSEIRIAVGYNPGETILVEVRSPLFESLTIPEVLADAVRDYDTRLIVSTNYGSAVMTPKVLATPGIDGDVEISITDADGGTDIPPDFIHRGAVYDITMKADGKTVSRFDAPVEIRIYYPIGADVDPAEVRVYHAGGEFIVPVEAEDRLNRFVSFRTAHFSEFAVKISDGEYSVTSEVEGDGNVILSTELAEEYVTVFVRAEAGEGQVLRSLMVDGKELEAGEGFYHFAMPASDAVVKAVFEAEGPEPGPEPGPGDDEKFPTVVVVAGIAVAVLAMFAALMVVRRR